MEQNIPRFLMGGGEMGALTRAYNWSESSLGNPYEWPASLRSTVSTILSARSPMFLWWGEELIQFYNDAYRPSLGDGAKHPAALGQRAEDCWPEIWQVIKPLIDQVLEGGGATYNENTLIPIYRNGQMEEVYWTFSYNPVLDDDSEIAGVLVVCQETTNEMKALKKLSVNESRFRNIVEQAPIAIGLFSGPEMIIETGNDRMFEVWGKDRSVIGKPVAEVLPGIQGQVLAELLKKVFDTGASFQENETLVELTQNGKSEDIFLDFTYTPLHDDAGQVTSVMVIAADVTQQAKAKKSLEESEAKLRHVIEAAPAAIGIFVGRDLMIEMPNQAFIDIVGKGPDITNRRLKDVMPELEGQPFLQILDDVFTSGKMFETYGSKVDVMRSGVMTTDYYDISYSPILDKLGQVYAILEIASNVTERAVAQKQIEESQMQLLSLFEQSTVAIAIIDKQNLTFKMANPFYGDLVGRKPAQLEGKSLHEALPEIADQGFDQLLNEVIRTGIPFISREQRVEIVRNGVFQTIYVDLAYQPKQEADGTISGVMVIATDVTEQILTRQSIQEAEITLRGAVELAELGTWQIDLATGILEYSERLREWFGIGPDETITVERAYSPIQEQDRPLVKAAITHAITPGTDAIYDVEYTLNPAVAGVERILHAQGKTYFNEKGEAYKINGTVQDVTQQRKIKLALEQLVLQRTQELESANEELAAGNEELGALNEEFMAINDELSISNGQLARSNENLQQFAYVASHDLQEPLRKVQSFGDLLMQRYAPQLGDGREYVIRMQNAAKRMSVLIADLLTFSRVSVNQDSNGYVSLDKVVKSVLNTLELLVQESGAKVTIGKLPEINGDNPQLEQLFQNLLSNAIKFRKPDTTPLIDVDYTRLTHDDMPYIAKPLRAAAAYHRIDITDNGIGFDTAHTDRIFQVFQRLHGKNEYEGTGIGLAICDKVATNHGGAITAASRPGHGSTFSLFLPAEQ
jgi:PAS domain S-box-containing protein